VFPVIVVLEIYENLTRRTLVEKKQNKATKIFKDEKYENSKKL